MINLYTTSTCLFHHLTTNFPLLTTNSNTAKARTKTNVPNKYRHRSNTSNEEKYLKDNLTCPLKLFTHRKHSSNPHFLFKEFV